MTVPSFRYLSAIPHEQSQASKPYPHGRPDLVSHALCLLGLPGQPQEDGSLESLKSRPGWEGLFFCSTAVVLDLEAVLLVSDPGKDLFDQFPTVHQVPAEADPGFLPVIEARAVYHAFHITLHFCGGLLLWE
jgi:hypothetical protein